MGRLWKRRLPYSSYLLCECFYLALTGHFDEVMEKAEEGLRILRTDRLTPHSKIDHRLGEGAYKHILSSIFLVEDDERARQLQEELEEMGVHFFGASACLGRVLRLRMRGEEAEARELEVEARLRYVQLGSMWLWEAQRAWLSAMSYGWAKDLPALRRSIEDLRQLATGGVKLGDFIELARGEYQRERGDVELSRQTLTALLRRIEGGENVLLQQQLLAALGETLLRGGDIAGAKRVTRRGLELTESVVGGRPNLIRNALTLALAEAAAGEVDRAWRRIDYVYSNIGSSPMVHGTVHEAYARVAWRAGDIERFRQHLERMERWFRSTRNPALVARYEKLAARLIDVEAAVPVEEADDPNTDACATDSWQAA